MRKKLFHEPRRFCDTSKSYRLKGVGYVSCGARLCAYLVFVPQVMYGHDASHFHFHFPSAVILFGLGLVISLVIGFLNRKDINRDSIDK